MSYVRLVVENLLKYGVLLTLPPLDMREWPRTWPCLSFALAMIFAAPTLAYGIEFSFLKGTAENHPIPTARALLSSPFSLYFYVLSIATC